MNTIKKIFKYISFFLLALLSYGLLVTLLSYVPVNANQFATDEQKVDIYILSNGVHTDIVVPVKNEFCDWTKTIKFEKNKV